MKGFKDPALGLFIKGVQFLPLFSGENIEIQKNSFAILALTLKINTNTNQSKYYEPIKDS